MLVEKRFFAILSSNLHSINFKPLMEVPIRSWLPCTFCLTKIFPEAAEVRQHLPSFTAKCLRPCGIDSETLTLSPFRGSPSTTCPPSAFWALPTSWPLPTACASYPRRSGTWYLAASPLAVGGGRVGYPARRPPMAKAPSPYPTGGGRLPCRSHHGPCGCPPFPGSVARRRVHRHQRGIPQSAKPQLRRRAAGQGRKPTSLLPLRPHKHLQQVIMLPAENGFADHVKFSQNDAPTSKTRPPGEATRRPNNHIRVRGCPLIGVVQRTTNNFSERRAFSVLSTAR